MGISHFADWIHVDAAYSAPIHHTGNHMRFKGDTPKIGTRVREAVAVIYLAGIVEGVPSFFKSNGLGGEVLPSIL